MPCYEQRIYSVVFQAGNRALLLETLDRMKLEHITSEVGKIEIVGKGITLDLQTERAEVIDGRQSLLNTIKQEYSFSAIRKVAKRNGWRVNVKDKATQSYAGTMSKM